MFDIGWPEMMVVVLVLIIVVGPKDLPRVIRTVSKWVAKARGMAREFQGSIDDLARQADLEDVRREINSIGSPDIGKELEGMIDPTISGMDYPAEKRDQPAEQVAAPAAPAAAPPDPAAPPGADTIGPAPAADGAAVAGQGDQAPVPEEVAVAAEPPAKRAAGA